jgi:hypothetical protein
MHISDKIDELNTGLIVISHLPPLDLTRPVIWSSE